MSVAAIIVTYNKLAPLKICLDAVQAQTHPPDEIIVIDNGSTDGTADWLDSQPGFTTIHQDNLGSSGGQNTGISTAFTHGHDWAWSMDDDGKPNNTALEHLLHTAKKNNLHFVNSLVLDIDRPDQLSFDLSPGLRTQQDVIARSRNGLLWDAANPFNGVLLSRHLFETAGNVERGLFIWGDDMEFSWRIQKAGFRLATSIHAIHFHPHDQFSRKKIMGGILGTMMVPPPTGRCYFYYRNFTYIYLKYRALPSLWRFLFKAMIHALMCKNRRQQLPLYAQGVYDGLRGDFSKNNMMIQR